MIKNKVDQDANFFQVIKIIYFISIEKYIFIYITNFLIEFIQFKDPLNKFA